MREGEQRGRRRRGEDRKADEKEQVIWQSSAPSTQDPLDLLGTQSLCFQL